MSLELAWTRGESTVSWTHDGKRVDRTFEKPPLSVAVWDDPACVIVVEDAGDTPGTATRFDNAVVLNPKGDEVTRLKPPQVTPRHTWIGFYTVYPSAGHLVCVFSTTSGDFWGDPDLKTGELQNVTQWR